MAPNVALMRARLRHRLRFAHQMFSPPATACVGAYHYENVGDMALAATGCAYWPGSQRPALQTSANISKWPGKPVTLVCGGAIVTETLLQQLRYRFGNAPEKLALIGVELARDATPLSRESVAFLKNLPFVAIRNQDQIDYLAEEYDLCRPLHLVPDIAFDAPFQTHEPVRDRETPVLGVNVTPGTGKDHKHSAHERSIVQRVRRAFYRTAVEAALDRGWHVEHVPFEVRDVAAAAAMFDGLPIQFAAFDADPARVFARVSTMAAFVPSRYHALIFALRAGLPVAPFCYARKNYMLFKDFLDEPEPFGFREALAGPSESDIRAHAERFWTLPEARLTALRVKVRDMFAEAFGALGQSRPAS